MEVVVCELTVVTSRLELLLAGAIIEELGLADVDELDFTAEVDV